MAFDAAMVSFVTREINDRIKDGKVEKIYQPQKNEIIIAIRNKGETLRLLIDVGSSNARINLTSIKPDNPAKAPMFCMMLRKHFQGAKAVSAEQLGFERAVRITFDAYDELGFLSHKHMIIEIMGTYSNLIITDSEDRIIGASKIIEFSQSSKRPIIVGAHYELPPSQSKLNPIETDRKAFLNAASCADEEKSASKFIVDTFAGIAPVTAREIVFKSCGSTDGTLFECREKLCDTFFSVISDITCEKGKATLICRKDGTPVEYGFFDICQYGTDTVKTEFESFGELIDAFFGKRANTERIKHRSFDVQRILSNAEKRITKKTALIAEELEATSDGEKFRLYGDLITANIYRLKKGLSECVLENYYDEMKPVTVPLDTRLTPSQNAQKYYKKYAKSKSAKEHLAKQLELSAKELEYIKTVSDALTRADSEKEISEIRSELYHSGYASKMKGYSEKKKVTPTFAKYRTDGGYTVYCGKNNLANDYVTFKLSDRGDWWFHVKNMPGSHVLMKCKIGEEPSEIDFTEAAMIAACNSKARGGAAVDVDYTNVKNVKKPSGSKPGFVIYHTNYSTRVVPDEEQVKELVLK